MDDRHHLPLRGHDVINRVRLIRSSRATTDLRCPTTTPATFRANEQAGMSAFAASRRLSSKSICATITSATSARRTATIRWHRHRSRGKRRMKDEGGRMNADLDASSVPHPSSLGRVAVIHDWLTGMRGGENVLEAILDLFPDAELFTLFHFPGTVSSSI